MPDTVAQSAVASFMSTLTDASAVRVPAELDRWSNRLAHLLISLGATHGTAVAVALTPSVESIVARTAISKAGAKAVASEQGVEPGAAAPIVAGMTTKAQRAGLSDAIDWLILDDVVTVRRYMTMPDVAP
ncbi:AMP-binding protein [Antrihabitans stalactiti]|uniref:AMP-binding protein n=1 Tax=Antrihabitans stalactiti TaxID=2584121 RepID=A0A848K9A7_9NOCA|nr:AMP-binding protein [Antrihabitans stalactiti]NMN94236.1 AMP-binding protein [Antrihabitans stalactiti]